MKRFILVIGIGLLAVNGAHAQDCPANPPKYPNPSNFDSHVFLPDAGYTPVAVGLRAAKTPSCSNPADPTNAQAIRAAFVLAPPGLQADLCKLKCIVVLNDSGSWGKWANNKNPKYGGDGSAVIGVGTDDLNPTITLSQKLNNNLIGVPGSHTVTAGDDAAHSLMYTLAHEMAHIKWHRDFTNGISPGCTQDNFIKTSWQGPAGSKVRRWTHFGEEYGNIKNNNIKFPSEVTSANDVNTIYTASSGAFATALGATNPEEDFVESYAIGAFIARNIANHRPATITLTLSPTINIPVDDPSFRNNTDLGTKWSTCTLPILQSAAIVPEEGYGQKRGDGRKKSRKKRR